MSRRGLHPRGWLRRFADPAIGLALCAGYVGLLLVTEADLGPARDEAIYTTAAERYGSWFELLWREPDKALQRGAIDHAWSYNHEHPGLAKSVFALFRIAQRHGVLFEDETTAVRFGGMLAAGLLLWLVYAWGRRLFGRLAGLSAALLLAGVPRLFHHAHLAAFDVPIVTALLWTTYAYWRSLRSARWIPVVGLAYGVALGIKHNAWVLPGVLLVHWVWMAAAEWRARRAGAEPALSLRPWWLLSMATLGPLVFVASWPWLWHDGRERFLWYANFHLKHVHYHIQYLGTSYWRPPFPWHVPFVSTAFTVPSTTLLLGLGVLLGRARAWWPLPRPRLRGGPEPDARRTDVLLLGNLLAPMVVIALPWTPIFGATKHWLAAYPFLALYAGEGVRRVLEALGRLLASRPAPLRAGASGAAILLLLAPAAVETVHAHPFGLSYYGPLAGGPPGGADWGMNRQFWGYTTGSATGWIAERLPGGGRIFLCDTLDKAWWMMQADGRAPRNVRSQWNLGAADLALVHHEKHFAEVDGQAWVAFGTAAPAYVLTYDGVPIVSIYENPRRARAREARRGGSSAKRPAGSGPPSTR